MENPCSKIKGALNVILRLKLAGEPRPNWAGKERRLRAVAVVKPRGQNARGSSRVLENRASARSDNAIPEREHRLSSPLVLAVDSLNRQGPTRLIRHAWRLTVGPSAKLVV